MRRNGKIRQKAVNSLVPRPGGSSDRSATDAGGPDGAAWHFAPLHLPSASVRVHLRFQFTTVSLCPHHFPTTTGPIFVPILDRFYRALPTPWSVHCSPPISRRKRRGSGAPQDASRNSAHRCLGLDGGILSGVLDGNAPRALRRNRRCGPSDRWDETPCRRTRSAAGGPGTHRGRPWF